MTPAMLIASPLGPITDGRYEPAPYRELARTGANCTGPAGEPLMSFKPKKQVPSSVLVIDVRLTEIKSHCRTDYVGLHCAMDLCKNGLRARPRVYYRFPITINFVSIPASTRYLTQPTSIAKSAMVQTLSLQHFRILGSDLCLDR